MKKLLILLIISSLAACSSKERTSFSGCKYEVNTSIFSDTTEINVISTDFRGTDISKIVLETVIDSKTVSPLSIKLPQTTLFYGKQVSKLVLPEEAAEYLRNNVSKMYKGEDIKSVINKDSQVWKRLQ